MQVEIGRARLQPVRLIHVRSPRSQSPPFLSSSGTRTARSQARTHSSERARRERRGKHNQPRSLFFPRADCTSSADMLLIMIFVNNMLMQTICLCNCLSICDSHERSHCSASAKAGPDTGTARNAGEVSLLKERLRGAKRTQWKLLTIRAVGPLESRLCVLRSQADHAQTVYPRSKCSSWDTHNL